MSTLDENDDEFIEELPETWIVKEEIESDHELLKLNIKKEFNSLEKKEKKINRMPCGKPNSSENNFAYHCQICEAIFKSFYDYETHRKQHSVEMLRKDTKGHGIKTRVRCGFCNKPFKSDEVLAAHHKNVHKELKFTCEYCGKIYLSLYSMNKHVKSVHYKIKCDKCIEIFFDRALFKLHRRQHKEDSSIACQYCHKEFDNTKNLYIHINMQHKKDEIVRMCDICHKEFINMTLLKRHYGRTHDKCFKCPHCDKAFGLRCSFERHFLTHTGAKDYKCHVCGRQFSRQRSYKNHVALHSDKRSFQCNQCPKAFKTQPSLRVHKFSHSTGEKFQCAMCLQEFTNKLYLINHINSHTTEKHYKCQTCTKQFKTYTWYKRHKDICGHEKNEHICDFCDKNFSTQVLLEDHLAGTHHENRNPINKK